jgi:acetoin utilization deacetylase AcuC-like enzyme
MGFCLINNAAVAAEFLLQNTDAKKLAILDFDLHHGNGTQDILWERGDILYISTHQWPLYPGTGKVSDIGVGPGEFATANLPLPPGSGDDCFDSCLDEFILPVLNRFEAEMLLISVGFDAHWKDPLGFLQLSAAGYGYLIAKLKAWTDQYCQGRIALILEGGYNLEAVSACTQTTCAALIGYPIEDEVGHSPYPETDRWRSVLEQAKSIWQIS